MKTGILGVTACAALLLGGCSGLRRLPPERFMAQGEAIHGINSWPQYTHYIGSTGDKVFLEYWRAPLLFGSGVHRVYWIPVKELPTDVQQELKAGKNPWASPRKPAS